MGNVLQTYQMNFKNLVLYLQNVRNNFVIVIYILVWRETKSKTLRIPVFTKLKVHVQVKRNEKKVDVCFIL